MKLALTIKELNNIIQLHSTTINQILEKIVDPLKLVIQLYLDQPKILLNTLRIRSLYIPL